MMERCTWKGQHVPCDMLFKSVATPYGFCCSFNYFGLKQDSMARLYTVSPQAPKRVSATGFLTGLEIIVNSILEDYFTRIIPSIGHKIILHFPYDFPDRNSQMLLQYIEELLLISVHPVLYRIDNNVKALEIDQRNCSFVGEKRLEYFTYTFHNCMSECRANLIRNICECVPFYYIHFYNYSTMKSIRICNLRDSICINQNIDRIYKSYSNCTCMQNCNYVRYSVETSSSIFTKQFVNHKPALYSGVKLNNQSVIRIYFDDLVSTRYTTSLRYYWHTILGRIGGVLGILIGLSATSLIEIMYFFIIRPIIDILFQYRIIYFYAKNGYK
ncbi:hypothetical protein FQR65_LT13680 [Abscondita terminalis]|nr:hypothetical protein FQR65_LT13680 [Abscondita terminalis]